jgi:hypothetical protein
VEILTTVQQRKLPHVSLVDSALTSQSFQDSDMYQSALLVKKANLKNASAPSLRLRPVAAEMIGLFSMSVLLQDRHYCRNHWVVGGELAKAC